MAERSVGGLAQVSIASKTRPPILKRTSFNSAQSTNSSASLLGSPRKEKITTFDIPLPSGGSKAEPMAAAFLQYCAMCEKQIAHPSSSILYCSEACRRKDSKKPLSAATIMPSSSSYTPPSTGTFVAVNGTYSPPASAPSSPRSILPPRLPTGVSEFPPHASSYSHPHSTGSSARIPADDHGFKSDLDPTEWKPNLRARGGRPPGSRHNSEAFRYLMSFHRSISKNDDNGEYDVTADGIRIEVPKGTSIDGAADRGFGSTAPPTPSLGNTPTTTASSSWSAYTSTSTSMSMGTGSGTGGYDFNTRPLMPRHNRWYSSSSGAGYGMDLVTPHIPPPSTAASDAYAKRTVMMMDMKKQDSGLGAFFGGGSASIKE